MRAVIVALCCGATTVILQGCGGGGSSTCMASQFNIPSQSITGTVTGTVIIETTTLTTTMPISLTIKEMLDLEKFNFRSEEAMEVKINEGPTHMDMQVEAKMLLLADLKKVVIYEKQTNATSKKVILEKCTSQIVKGLPSPAELSLIFKGTILPTIQKASTCGGNDGTYDTWSFDAPIPASLPPIDNATVTGKITEKVQMTKDSLLHSAASTLNAQAVDKDQKSMGTMTETSNMQLSDAKAGGPSGADLDYSKWGKCDPKDEEVDIETLFKAHHVKGFEGHGFFHKRVLATIQVALKQAQQKSVVV